MPQEDSFLLPAKNRTYINLYEMDINFAQPENYINDMLEISDNLLIVLFINLIFLFNIENNEFNMIKLLQERYKLVKCCKYDKTKIMIGSEKNLLVYEILDNFALQKIAIIELGIEYRKNYYFFNIVSFVVIFIRGSLPFPKMDFLLFLFFYFLLDHFIKSRIYIDLMITWIKVFLFFRKIFYILYS